MTGPYPRYAWPEGRRAAFCFSVDVDAESPYLWGLPPDKAPLLGQMEQRLFGPRTGLWRLLDLLDRYDIKGSFFVPGIVARHHPALLPAIVAAGHEVGLHGYFHEIVADTPTEEFVRALDAALDLFKAQAGIVPSGFRSPAWELTPAMLVELGKRGLYDSSLQGFDHPYTIDGVTEVPVQWAVDDAIYFKFVGGGADRWPPAPQESVLAAWRDEWTVLAREGGLMMLTVHDWISGRAGRLLLLERLLDAVTATPGVWLATAGELAAHHAASPNRDRFAVAARVPEPSGPQRFRSDR